MIWQCVYKWEQSSHHKPVLWDCVKHNHDFWDDIIVSFKIRWVTCYQVFIIGAPTIYVHAPDVQSSAWWGVLKSLTLDKRWFDNMFISGENPHLTSQFCGVMLGPITIFKNYISQIHHWTPNILIKWNLTNLCAINLWYEHISLT